MKRSSIRYAVLSGTVAVASVLWVLHDLFVFLSDLHYPGA